MIYKMESIKVINVSNPPKYPYDKTITLENDTVIEHIPYEQDVDVVFEYIDPDSDLKSIIILPEYTHNYLDRLVNSTKYINRNGESKYLESKKVFFDKKASIEDKIDIINQKSNGLQLSRMWFREKIRVLKCNNIKTFSDINKHLMYLVENNNKCPTIDDLINNLHLFKNKMFMLCASEIKSNLNIKYFKKLKPCELITHDTRNNNLYFTCFYVMEEHVVKFIEEKLTVPPEETVYKIPREFDKLSGEQIKAIHNALNCELSIINGGPGTGKSTIIKIITELNLENNKKTIVTSFTGKSIHRLIESGCDETTTRTMDRLIIERMNYIDHVIIDECSMVSLELFFRFIVKYPECKFTFVGDIDQLPPIGAGFVFKALLSIQRIPLVTLNTNYRSGVNTKNWFDSVSFNHDNLTIKQAVDKFIDEGFDICISPLNKIVDEFNDLVRIQLGRTGRWDIGDIVISTTNIRGDKKSGSPSILNGLSGTVVDVQRTHLYVKFEGKSFRGLCKFKILSKYQEIQQSILDEELGSDADEESITTRQIGAHKLHTGMLKYGYAITVHKSQGSEYNKVLIVTGNNYWDKFYTRNLLFTAVTRYKKEIFVAGPDSLIQKTVKNKLVIPPDTFLKKMERI